MTDINTELESYANEVFVEEEQLDEIAADAPTKGAAPGDQKAEKLPGEVQDMGPAVVSPDATSDMGDAATKKAKKATPPGSAGGKGLPSNAKATAVGDGSGPMKSGAREELEYEDEDVIAED